MKLFYTFILLFTISFNIFAASGGFSNDGSDMRSLGNANAVTARADSPATNWFNPAGLTRLEGKQLSASLMSENLYFEFDSVLGKTIEAEPVNVFVPSIFYTYNLAENFALGFGINSAYGLCVEFDDPVTDYLLTKTDLKIINFNPNIAYNINDKLSIAIGLDIHYSTALIEKKINQTLLNTYLYTLTFGTQILMPSNDGFSKLEGDDTSIGTNLALLYIPNDKMRFGLSYRSKVNFTFEGEVTMSNLEGLTALVFGGTEYETDAEVNLSIPTTITIGLAYYPNNKTTIEFDIEWAGWKSMDELHIKYDETNVSRRMILNSDNPATKDWNNTFNYSLGVEHILNTKYTIFGGLRYRPTPIPERTYDIMVPGMNLIDIMGGFTYNFEESKIDVVFDYLYGQPRDITNYIGNTVGTTINGEHKINGYVLGVAYTVSL